MKRILPLLVFIFAGSSLFAQTPQAVTTAFGDRFGSITGQWTEQSGQYTIQFTDNTGHACAATYSATGDLVTYSQQITRPELTANVEAEISNRFLGSGSMYSYVSAANVENNEGNFQSVVMSTGNGGNLRVYFDSGAVMVKRELF